MASHLAVVSATRKKKHGAKATHLHPVRRMTIEPDTDGGGFHSETEMHPPEQNGENSMYSPGEVMKKSHSNYAALQKHVKGTLNLKTDGEEGNGMTDPGSAEDAEDKE